MSHVGNGEHDLDDLRDLKLPLAVLEDIKSARIEARDIIDRLEPCHINGWLVLIKKLEYSLRVAKRNQKFFRTSQIEHLKGSSEVKIYHRRLENRRGGHKMKERP